MSVFNVLNQRKVKQMAFASLVGLFGVISVCSVAWSDTIHFYNGQIIEGNLYRIIGDVIRYKADQFFSMRTVNRLQLANRVDVVETYKRSYIGEVVYLDFYGVEIRTPMGKVYVNKPFIRHISLGIPQDLQETIEHDIQLRDDKQMEVWR